MPSAKRDSLDLPLCLKCGGRCCQGSPGVWTDPSRFFAILFSEQRLTVEQLRERLPELGLVFWEKTGTPIPAPRSLASGCAFHGPEGCHFSVVDRPCQCLALIPNKETLHLAQGSRCQLPEKYSMEMARQRWQAYWQAV